MKTLGYRSFDDHDPLSELHSPYAPAEIRANEPFSCGLTYTTDGLEKTIELPIWRLSPLGIELRADKSTQPLEKGQNVNIKLKIGNTETEFYGLIVDHVVEKLNLQILGIRLVAKIEQRVSGADRRTQRRWVCSEHYQPTLCALNPGKFNDYIYFMVRDISESGLRLITSLRNKFIVVGMKLDCIASFPLVSQTRITIEITNLKIIEREGKEYLSIGASIVNEDIRIREVMSQYLLQFGIVDTLRDLKAERLPLPSTQGVVEYGFVKTEDEYREVLNLRYEAYNDNGKLPEWYKAKDMADQFDSRARIAIGKIKGKIVVSARLIFNEIDQKMEQESYINWPQDLPRREEVVEIMRLCTSTEYRGSDLLTGMFQFIAISVVQSKRPWIVTCSTDDMLSIYEKIGFKKVNLNYNHIVLNNTLHHVLIANVPNVMCGKGVDPITWNLLWSSVSRYLNEYNIVTPDLLLRLRMVTYRLFSPLAQYIGRFMKKPRKAKLTSGALGLSKKMLKSA